MTKKNNLTTLMAGTTALLLGMNVFVTPAQAAITNQVPSESKAALDKEALAGQSSSSADTSKDSAGAAHVAAASASDSNTGNKGTGEDNSEQQSGKEDTNKNSSEQSQPQAETTDQKTDNKSNNADTITKSSIYEDTTKVKDENGNETTIGEIAKNQHEHNALGLAGMFGIFSKETTISADNNSNIATKEYHKGNEFGTRGESHNLADKDISYIGKIDDMGANAFRTGNNVVVVGENDNVTINGNQVQINGKRLDHLNANDLRKESDINPDKKYIDIDAEFDELEKRSEYFSNQKQNQGVKLDFADMNNQSIDVSNAQPDKNNAIYVDLDAKFLSAAQPVRIKGLESVKNSVQGAPTIVINVRNINNNEVVSGTQTVLVYGDGEEVHPNEGHNRSNHVLWNFGKDLSKLDVNSGYMMGSILAPNAVVSANVNIDGNIAAKTVNIVGGEYHHWDLHPGFPDGNHSFIDIPTQPTSQPTEQPTQQPTKQPTQQPTKQPTQQPTKQPTQQPTKQPTQQPTKQPTQQPTKQPTQQPTKQPTQQPTKQPTQQPTKQPTQQPTKQPTKQPTQQPTKQPTQQPTKQPTQQPTKQPTQQPTKPTQPTTVKPKDEIPFVPFFPAYPEIPNKPEQPTVPGQPTQPSIPGVPNFLKPQPKTPEQPQTPDFSEPKSKTPLPDANTFTPNKPKATVEAEVFFKAQAKKHAASKKPVSQAPKIEVENNKVKTAKTVTTAAPKSKVEQASVEKVSVKKTDTKAAALPQTGEKQNHSVLLGLVLSAVALIAGFFGKAKKD